MEGYYIFHIQFIYCDNITTVFLCNLITFQTLNPIYLEGYYIYFRPQSNVNPLNNEYKVISVLHSGDTSAFEINDLMKYTEYEFFLLPFYRDIEGKPSNLRITKTLEDGKINHHTFFH